MSTLYNDIDIEVVRLTLTPKGGGGVVDYYFAQDYWDAGTVYVTNPVFYPLLIGSPKAQYGVDAVAGLKYSTQIQIHGDSHLSRYGKSFMDILKTYEIHNAVVQVLYYSKPWTSTALTTHADNVNIRQVMRVVSETFDEASGVMTLECSDMLFKDKEVSKRLSSSILTGLDSDWKSEYGAVVFGQSTVSGDGIAIDAPYFDSKIDGSNRPVAKLFSGWTYPNHPLKAFKRLFAKNPDKTQNKNEWVVVSLETDPQTAAYGEAVSVVGPADPPNWPRDLTRYARAITNTPSTDAAKIITAVRSYLKLNTQDRCADIPAANYFIDISNPGVLSKGDDDFTFELWVNFDALHDGTKKRIICEQGNANKKGKLEWQLYFDTSTDKPIFGISSNGTSVTDSVQWSAALSTGTWYAIYCVYDSVANKLKINVNAGTTVQATRGGSAITSRDGNFTVGSRNLSGSELSFDGKVKIFRFWNRALVDGDILTMYNSGTPILTSDISDYQTQELSVSNEFNDPFGVRYAIRGGLDLTPNSTDGSARDIAYAYASCVSITPSNQYGEVSVSIDEAESLDSGNTVNPKDRTIAKATIDVTTSALTSGTSNTFFQIDPPFVMAPSATYTTILDMANAETNTYFALCAYEDHAGSTHQALDKRTKKDKSQPNQNWAKQTDIRLDMQHYYLGQGDDTWTSGTGSGADRYAYQHLEAKSITLSNGQSHKTFAESLDFKICVSGLQDDGSGTYTGSASAVIEKPQHIIKFTLMNSDFGLGLTSTDVDTSSISTAVTDMDAAYVNSLKMQAVIEGQTGAEDFILELCRQSRTIFYKKRNGKLALKFPRYTTDINSTFSEMYHRGEFQLLAVADNDYSTVINDFDQLYKRDTFFLPNDTATNRRDPGEKLSNEIVLNSTTSTAGDSDRLTKCLNSLTLYGKREHKSPLSFYDSSTYAQTIQNYYCDRYSTLQKRASFEYRVGLITTRSICSQWSVSSIRGSPTRTERPTGEPHTPPVIRSASTTRGLNY